MPSEDKELGMLSSKLLFIKLNVLSCEIKYTKWMSCWSLTILKQRFMINIHKENERQIQLVAIILRCYIRTRFVFIEGKFIRVNSGFILITIDLNRRLVNGAFFENHWWPLLLTKKNDMGIHSIKLMVFPPLKSLWLPSRQLNAPSWNEKAE